MTTEPGQIRARIDAMLAELPDLGEADDGGAGDADTDFDEMAQRLSAAHDVLVRALESTEKG